MQNLSLDFGSDTQPVASNGRRQAVMLDAGAKALIDGGAVAVSAESSELYGSHAAKLLTEDELAACLSGDKTASRIQAKDVVPAVNDLVGVRLNLNVFKNTGQCVHSVHKGSSKGGHRHQRGLFGGEVLMYSQVVVLKNAFFNVSQKCREAIARGESKRPMASVDGELVALDSTGPFKGVMVRFNPKQEHLFVDMNGHAVAFAEHVVLFGHRAFCTGLVVYHSEATAPTRAGEAESRVRFLSE